MDPCGIPSSQGVDLKFPIATLWKLSPTSQSQPPRAAPESCQAAREDQQSNTLPVCLPTKVTNQGDRDRWSGIPWPEPRMKRTQIINFSQAWRTATTLSSTLPMQGWWELEVQSPTPVQAWPPRHVNAQAGCFYISICFFTWEKNALQPSDVYIIWSYRSYILFIYYLRTAFSEKRCVWADAKWYKISICGTWSFCDVCCRFHRCKQPFDVYSHCITEMHTWNHLKRCRESQLLQSKLHIILSLKTS